jgi:glycosyltransferase involved in cell wall biosynthesis
MSGIEKIALLGPAPPDRGGIARETALLARELAASTAVAYFTFSRPYPRWLDPRRFDCAPGDSAVPAGVPSLDYRSPRSWRATARRIVSFEPDVLVAPWWTSFWGVPLRSVFRAVERASPKVLRALLCHNVEDHESGPVRGFLALGAFFSADAFVVHAESDRRRLERRVPGRPVAVLAHPTVTSLPPDRDGARRELGISTPLVLFLGLVRRYKGVDLLLDAAPRIVRETNARIAIVGEVFPDAQFLEERWKQSPVRESIVWRDEYVTEEEMGRWLAACDVVVLPYRYVSGSGIAARAVAARRPMAAASVGGLSETVQPGVTGELFPVGDPNALADAVRRIVERGISRYENGLTLAAEESSWSRYVERLLAFFSGVRSAR